MFKVLGFKNPNKTNTENRDLSTNMYETLRPPTLASSVPLIPLNEFTNLVVLLFYPTAFLKELLLQSLVFLNSNTQ